MTHPTEYAPGSAIITAASYARQMALAGTYYQMGQYRRRCWYPPRSVHLKMKRFILARDGACVQCGSSTRLHLDHIKPYRLGGLYVEWNLQALCESCNSRKGAKLVEK